MKKIILLAAMMIGMINSYAQNNENTTFHGTADKAFDPLEAIRKAKAVPTSSKEKPALAIVQVKQSSDKKIQRTVFNKK